MALNAETAQDRLRIDRKIGKLLDAGRGDLAIMGDMSDYMPEFQRLMETSSREQMDALCAHLQEFAVVIETRKPAEAKELTGTT